MEVEAFRPVYSFNTIEISDTVYPEENLKNLADSISLRFSRLKYNNIVHCDSITKDADQYCSADFSISLKINRLSIFKLKDQRWRSTGPGYESPRRYKAVTECELKVIRNSDSAIIKKVTSKASVEQPFLHTFFSKRIKETDVVRYSSHLYAPPPMRALYKAIKKAYEKL